MSAPGATGTASAGPMPARLRAYLANEHLAPLWAAVRTRLEGNGLNVAGTMDIVLDPGGLEALSGLLAAPVHVRPTGAVRVSLAGLDDALRASIGARGLLAVLGELSGPLNDRQARRTRAAAAVTDLWAGFEAQLTDAGLAGAGWVRPWLAGLRRNGVLTRAGNGAQEGITRAVSVLAVLAATQPLADADPGALRAGLPAPAIFELGELAARCCAQDAHGLDDGEPAASLVLRALAAAYGMDAPGTATARRDLWGTAGVAPDAVSGTVLVWGLRPPGTGAWATMMGDRADLGLVTHITLQEWRAAAGTVPWAEPGAVVHACENPQVLQAAARAGAKRPLVCTSGNPATVAQLAIDAMVGAGVQVAYHGDFDVAGVQIAGRLFARGVQPWRFACADYSGALAVAEAPAGHGTLELGGQVGPTPWDPALARAMNTAGVGVHEEALLETLLGDLGDGR